MVMQASIREMDDHKVIPKSIGKASQGQPNARCPDPVDAAGLTGGGDGSLVGRIGCVAKKSHVGLIFREGDDVRIIWLASGLTEKAFLQNLLAAGECGRSTLETEVVVYSGIQREPSPELVSLIKTPRRFRRILVHISDEKLRHRNRVYSQFDVVLRNYFDPRMAWRKNVLFFPLGWTSMFGPNNSSPGETSLHTWSFCGAAKADRSVMLREFGSVEGGFHHLSSGWNSDDQLPPREVRKIYEDSTFVLCPQGNAHIDTFRVMEALQAGAIPVTTKFLGRDFFRYTFGNHPFVVARDWSAAASMVNEIQADSQRAMAYRLEVRHWYQEYLERLTLGVREAILDGAMGRQSVLNHSARMFARWDFLLMVNVWLRFRRYRH